ncbi:MAG: ORF6N domain-containing protein [Candidatus Omnitrophota bacterium]|nr:ORF6N domain-containing protein [Candidatus Omnitrophota bacterium]
MGELIPHERIERRIFVIRGHKVMLDRDLAELFQVPTKHLSRQVKRNIERFPKEFMFRLTEKEKDELVPNWHQFKKMKHSYALPYAFSKHGVAMLATVLSSEQAVKMSIIIIKTFIKLREMVITHKDLEYNLKELEHKVERHEADIQEILRAIRRLLEPPEEERRVIGFAKE